MHMLLKQQRYTMLTTQTAMKPTKLKEAQVTSHDKYQLLK